MIVPLMMTAQATLNGAGHGVVRFSPGIYNVKWHLTQATVKCSTAVKEATAQLTSFPYTLPGTSTGSTGDTTSLDLLLTASQEITCTWEGGDAGAIATFTIIGTKEIVGV